MRQSLVRFVISGICVSIMLVASASAWAHDERAGLPVVTAFPLVDLDGKVWDMNSNEAGRVRVFVFLSTECPVSNSYSKTLSELSIKLRRKGGVEFFGVIADPSTTRKAAATHAREYKLSFPVLFDASQQLASVLKVKVVPEAFVLDAKGVLVYRGKIDDAYRDIGRRRPNVQTHYLSDAVDALLTGKPIRVAVTEPVGCVFESLPANSPKAAKVTYNRDIAPIIHARCMNCHRPGQVAPFALTNYEQVAKRGRQILRVTTRRIMPPWMPTASHAKFVGDRRLTDQELNLLQQWFDGGRAEGNADDLPPAPPFAEGWRLGKPDLVVKMPKPFTVRADGPDLFQYFVLPLDVPEDKLVAAVEFLPGNKRVVHHAVLFLDDSGAARKLDAATPEPGYHSFGGPQFAPSGAIGGWSVGNTPRRLPNDMGRYLKKGSDLVIQVHYHPTGKVEVDQSTVGIYFVDKPVAQSLSEKGKLVGSIWMANYQMDIPAGERNYRRTARYKLPRPVTMVGVVPHMHLLGKSMKVTAALPSGKKVTLIDVARWDYNWQDEYYYEKPFKLPADTVLEVEAIYDNSEDNPSNPSSPPQRVTWGDETTDEMLFCFFLLTSDKVEDLIHVIHHNVQYDLRQPRAKVKD